MRSPLTHRRSIFFAFLLALSVWTLAFQTAVAQTSPPLKTPAREPFGSSLKRDKDFKRDTAPNEQKQPVDNEGLPTPEETIKVDTLLVSLNVVVTDESGTRFINGLKPEDFLIVEDNVPQQIATLTLGDDALRLPRSVIVIFDWSFSQLPYLEESVNAAKMLIDQLAKTDQMAIVTDSIFLLVDFTSDKKRLKSALDELLKQVKNGWRGQSKQFSALLATLRELIKTETHRPIIIFQTDGDESSALKDPPQARKASTSVYYISDIYAEVEKSRVKVYTVIPGEQLFGLSDEEKLARFRRAMTRNMESWYKANRRAERPRQLPPMPDNIAIKMMDTYTQNQEAAARVAELSGGWTEFLDTPERAAAIYSRILADINNHYILGYYPLNKVRDGQLRRVRVSVRNHPEYKIHGRQSYYATPR